MKHAVSNRARIIRTEHIITLTAGGTASALKTALAQVPDDATFMYVDGDELRFEAQKASVVQLD